MGPIEQLTAIVPMIEGIVDRIGVGDLAAPTPCDEFTVHDVLDHMIVLGTGFARLFRGEEPGDAAPPPVYGRVPAEEFRVAMDDLLAAVRSEGALARTLETPIGTMDGATFARVVAVDGLVHGWDLAVASRQAYPVDPGLVAEVQAFADAALSDDLRAAGLFAAAVTPPADATPIEALAAFSGRAVGRWQSRSAARRMTKDALPVKIDVPGATARQATSFGDASGYGAMAAEYFTLGAGTDIAPLLAGLHDDACHAPHWGFVIAGELVVSFTDGSESICRGGELFYWPPGHSVRVIQDADVVLFSPQVEHVAVLDHMLERIAAG